MLLPGTLESRTLVGNPGAEAGGGQGKTAEAPEEVCRAGLSQAPHHPVSSKANHLLFPSVILSTCRMGRERLSHTCIIPSGGS